MSNQTWHYDTTRRCPRCGGSVHLELDEAADLLTGQCRGPACGGFEGCSSFQIVGLLSSERGPIYSGLINRSMALAIARARKCRISFQRDNATWREWWSSPSHEVQIFQVSPAVGPVHFAVLVSEVAGAEPSIQRYTTFDEAYLQTFSISFSEELRRNSRR